MVELSEIGTDDRIYGHENVKSVLNAALRSGRIGHAYIFSGPAGVGKYTTAQAFAKKIVGTDLKEHPDIITVTNEWCGVESKSGALLVDTVKEMRRDIYIRPYSSGRKVYIVPHADSMLAAAQNSILKVFEEPPLYCTIILLAENSSKFLPTILSRANEIRFSPLPEKVVADYLSEVSGLPEDEAALNAVMSGGSIGAALNLLGSDGADDIRNRTISYLTSLVSGENRVIFDFAKFLKSEQSNIDFIFSILKSFFSDFAHLKFGLTDRIVNTDKMEDMKKLSRAVTKRAAVQFIDITLKYERVVKGNANFRITMFCMVCEYWEEIHGRNYRSSI